MYGLLKIFLGSYIKKNKQVLMLYMLSPEFDRYAKFTENARSMAYPTINDIKFYRALVPIPTLDERKRIVERVDTLLLLCEDLNEE